MRGRISAFLGLLIPLALGLPPGNAVAAETSPDDRTFRGDAKVVFDRGEVYEGDRYAFGGTVSVDGEIRGDLAAYTGLVTLDGVVRGDFFAFARIARLRGQVHDTTRIFAQEAEVDAVIDGDLLVFAETLTIGPNARITGNLHSFGAHVIHRGTVDGRFNGGGGDIELSGSVGGDADLTYDAVTLLETASIGGDLLYESRRELEEVPSGVVAGRVIFSEKQPDDDDGLTTFAVLLELWKLGGTLVLGGLLLRVKPEWFRASSDTLNSDAVMAGLVGYGGMAVTIGVAFFSLVLIVTIPLGVILLVLLAVTLYLGKIPLAVWLGEKLVGLAGLRSRALALIVGAVLLHLAFALVPWFLVRMVAWLFVAGLGLGAFALGLSRRLKARGGSDAVAA